MLYRELGIRSNLRFHARLHGLDDGRVDEVIAAVGLESRADEPVRDLSHGLARRAAAARAVLADPALILLDEPGAGLDPAAAAALEPLMGRASGRTRVLVTHDVERGVSESDVVLGLRAGRQVLAGPAREMDERELRELYR
jgi:heme exporter protein A